MDFLRDYAETRAFSLGQPLHARLVDGGERVLFLRGEARSASLSLFEHDLRAGTTTRLLSAPDLLGGDEELSEEEKARRERMRSMLRGLTSFSIAPDDDLLMLPIGGRVALYRRRTRHHLVLPIEDAIDPQLSPSGTEIAFVRDHDLYVFDIASAATRAITTGGNATRTFGLAEFVAQEEMGRMYGYVFSPDGRSLCYEEADTSDVEVLCIADPLRPEREPVKLRYPRAGKDNARVRLWIDGREEIVWDREKLPYLAAFGWSTNAPHFYVQDRTQRHAQLYLWKNGAAQRLLEERDDAWINLWRGMPKWVDEGFLWISERSGHARLELRADDGTFVRDLIAGAVDVVGTDRDGAYVLVTDDPTKLDLWYVRYDGKKQRIALDEGERTVHVRDDRIIDTCAGRRHFRTTTVRKIDGTVIATLPSNGETPALVPQPEWTTVALGDQVFHAAILRPQNKREKLPVILSVYGGPHHIHVTSMRELYFREQWLAEQGYAVVVIDNRGTPRRDRQWERAIAGDFATVPLQDQAAVLDALLSREPDLDRTRVGVYGWSFGGYMAALAVMKRPDLFKSGVAGAPVVDWHDYDTHYTERYLQLPQTNPDGYRHSSLLTHAASLQRPLLLIHGTADDNVYFFHSLKLSDALTRAGIAHELLPLAGCTHMVAEPDMVVRLWNAVLRHFDKTLKS